MIQQLRSKLERLRILTQKKVGIDPKRLHELLREMDMRSGGNGDYWLYGYKPAESRNRTKRSDP